MVIYYYMVSGDTAGDKKRRGSQPAAREAVGSLRTRTRRAHA